MKTIVNNTGDGISVVETNKRNCEFATKEILLEYLKEQFQKCGFKKTKQTWYKDDGELIYVFNLQNSQYGSDTFYFNIGLIFSTKGFKISNQEWNCWARFPYGKTMQNTFENILKWFEKYNSIDKIKAASTKPVKCLTDPRWRLDEILGK